LSGLTSDNYSQFKYVSDATANEFKNRYIEYNENQIAYNSGDNKYEIDENLDGKTDYTFDQPDFNKFDFNSNLVIRWEYMPGSTFFWCGRKTEIPPKPTVILFLTRI